MKHISATFRVEYLKIHKSKVFWLSIVFFLFVVFMIGILMFVQKYPEISGKLGMIGTKSAMLRLGEPDWQNYFALLNQMIAALGLIGFGFVTSWIFGREYSDRTIKDIIALPVSRSYIVISKFIAVALWNILLTIVMYVSGLIVGVALGTTGWSGSLFLEFTWKFYLVSFLSILLCTPVAFFAGYGRGYLLPIVFLILTMMMANFTGLVGLGPYFPWSVPGIFSAPPGPDNIHLNMASYIILFLTSAAGLYGTLAWWRYADQK